MYFKPPKNSLVVHKSKTRSKIYYCYEFGQTEIIIVLSFERSGSRGKAAAILQPYSFDWIF